MKKPVFIVIGVVCLALVFGFFIFTHFFWGTTVQVKDVRAQEVLTVKLNKQMVANVRFHVTGKLDGAATLYWNCSEGTRQSCRGEQRFEAGNVDLKGGTEWYSDTYTFVYEPSLEAKSGSISIRYE